MSASTLDALLNSFSLGGDPRQVAISRAVSAFADAAILLRKSINEGSLGSAFGNLRKNTNAGGDTQTDLDIHADNLFLAAARGAGAGYYASEELENPITIDPASPIAIAIDPLDGSSNIDTNISIGTIFSVLPSLDTPEATFRQRGNQQLAAGFFIYGPQLALVLTLGSGTRIFILSARLGTFVQAYKAVSISTDTKEFAINASNYRHWDECVRLYVDDCLQGSEGPRGKNFNMRWIASLVADTYRILIRGGVFLYPGDARKGYRHGRLRLVYEANPVAFLIENAGGSATDGLTRILDMVPVSLHQRTPLVFGSRKEVEKIGRYHSDPSAIGIRHPLFGNRGLFRA